MITNSSMATTNNNEREEWKHKNDTRDKPGQDTRSTSNSKNKRFTMISGMIAKWKKAAPLD